MSSVHGWSTASPLARSSSARRPGCAIIAFSVLVIYGLSNIGQAIFPLSPGIRGSEAFYAGLGLVFMLLAAAVWRLWLQKPRGGGTAAPIRRPRERSPLAGLLDHARRPDETSTDLLQWAWLIHLDLAFRDHLWIRIAVLVVGMIAVTLIVLLSFATGVLR